MQSLFELSDLLSQQVDVELLAVQLLLLALHLPLKLIDERALVGHGVHVHPHQLFGPSCNHSRSRVCSHTLTQVTAFLCERKHTYYIIFAYQITLSLLIKLHTDYRIKYHVHSKIETMLVQLHQTYQPLQQSHILYQNELSLSKLEFSKADKKANFHYPLEKYNIIQSATLH